MEILKYVHHVRIASRELDNPDDCVLHTLQFVDVRARHFIQNLVGVVQP